MKQMFSHALQVQDKWQYGRRVLQGILQGILPVVIGACVLTMSSQIAITLPFSCVPFTLQPQAVLALAVLLGPIRAFQSVLLFLLMGAMGLPVFAQGCSSLAHLIGPRGGYLMSYLLVAPLVGSLTAPQDKLWRLLSVLLLGSSLTLFCGWLWLSGWMGMSNAFETGVMPFVLSCLAKTVLVASGIKMGLSIRSIANGLRNGCD